jgi:DNA-binding NarL/FixJ family response regulator
MPEMDGYDTLENIKKHKEFQNIPFVYITAYESRKNFRQGMELGADDYLTKPFSRIELISAVNTQLRKSKNNYQYFQNKIENLKKEIEQELNLIKQEKNTREEKIETLQLENEKWQEKMQETELKTIEESIQSLKISKLIKETVNAIQKEVENLNFNSTQKQFLRQLRNNLNEKQLYANNWNIFQLRFQQQHPDFIPEILSKHGKFTSNEILFISATKLGLDTFQIADLLNISADSVRKNRYRVKKKMGLKKEENFLTYIRMF